MTTLIANARRARIDVPEVTRAHMQSRQWVRVWGRRSDAYVLTLPDNREWRITDAQTMGLPDSALVPCLLTLCDTSFEPHETIEVDALTFPTLIGAVRYAEQWRRDYLQMTGQTPVDFPQPNPVPSYDCA